VCPEMFVPSMPSVADGGARPEIRPQAPEIIAFPHDYPAASIIISTANRKLYYVLPDKQSRCSWSTVRSSLSWLMASHKTPQ